MKYRLLNARVLPFFLQANQSIPYIYGKVDKSMKQKTNQKRIDGWLTGPGNYRFKNN